MKFICRDPSHMIQSTCPPSAGRGSAACPAIWIPGAVQNRAQSDVWASKKKKPLEPFLFRSSSVVRTQPVWLVVNERRERGGWKRRGYSVAHWLLLLIWISRLSVSCTQACNTCASTRRRRHSSFHKTLFDAATNEHVLKRGGEKNKHQCFPFNYIQICLGLWDPLGCTTGIKINAWQNLLPSVTKFSMAKKQNTDWKECLESSQHYNKGLGTMHILRVCCITLLIFFSSRNVSLIIAVTLTPI